MYSSCVRNMWICSLSTVSVILRSEGRMGKIAYKFGLHNVLQWPPKSNSTFPSIYHNYFCTHWPY